MIAVWIHRGGKERGGAIYKLLGRGELKGAGTIRLRPAEHAFLSEGRFSVALYTTRNATGDLRAALLLE